MLNILPPQEKSILNKDYGLRRLIVWMWILGIVSAISLTLLVPSYFVSQFRASEAQTQLERSKEQLNKQLQPQDMTAVLSAATHNANDLKPFKPGDSAYDLLRIFENKPSTITVSNISFANQGVDAINGLVAAAGMTDRPTITVTGTAQDRDSLTSFGKMMESQPQFAAVELPVSNFVKEKNIDFQMTITLK